ncbi:hypothetical protein [Lyticum sinuosum]|uniref:Uncharacterized protein n=1 Tax=Lyticum sinuosum TaxID=1332059 RepID=A0AAE4VLI6_9RICK|nr:hypothetical protein [Lyticum sinuosum]MDZ5761006.1 hypothetical protein [Lyticum sinuosum]
MSLHNINELELNSNTENSYQNTSDVTSNLYHSVMSDAAAHKYLSIFFNGIKDKLKECFDISNKLKSSDTIINRKTSSYHIIDTTNTMIKILSNISKDFKRILYDKSEKDEIIMQIIVSLDELKVMIIRFQTMRDEKTLKDITNLVNVFEKVLNPNNYSL